MTRLGTWLLALLALLLVGVIVFGPESWRQPSLGAEEYVLRFDRTEVRAVEIVRDGETLRFQRVADGWEMGPRPTDRAHGAAVEQILEAAQLLRILDRIAPREISREDEKKWGFANPRLLLRLETARGPAVLLFGREGAGPDRIFVRQDGRKDIFLVQDELHQLLLRPTDAFRDPRLVALPVSRLERLRLTRPDGTIEWVKQGGRWQLVRPLQAPADDNLVEKALEQILGARIFSFQSNSLPAEGTETLGLIELWPEGEDQPVALQVFPAPLDEENAAPCKERLLVWHPARQATVQVPAENFSLLRQPPDHWRNRQLVALDFDLVDRITLHFGGQQLSLGRSGLDDWQQLPASDQRLVSSAWVEQLWNLLQQTRVVEFLLAGAPGLLLPDGNPANSSPPDAEIFLDSWLSENTPEAQAGRHPLWHLQLWRAQAESSVPPQVLARLDGEAGGRLLPTEFWEKLQQWWQQRPDTPAAEKP